MGNGEIEKISKNIETSLASWPPDNSTQSRENRWRLIHKFHNKHSISPDVSPISRSFVRFESLKLNNLYVVEVGIRWQARKVSQHTINHTVTSIESLAAFFSPLFFFSASPRYILRDIGKHEIFYNTQSIQLFSLLHPRIRLAVRVSSWRRRS